MNKLLESAYSELKKLEKSQPSWEVYEKIAMLKSSVDYFERESANSINADNELSRTIQKLNNNFGADKTVEILARSLEDFVKDLNYVSPQLVNCLIKRLKENV